VWFLRPSPFAVAPPRGRESQVMKRCSEASLNNLLIAGRARGSASHVLLLLLLLLLDSNVHVIQRCYTSSHLTMLHCANDAVFIYINLLFTKKLVAHKNTKTNLNKLNQHATCSQISQHGGRAEHWA